MPRNVRNFWIELDVDGRKERVETGPVRADGGFQMTIRIRDEGSISDTVLLVEGNVNTNTGEIVLVAAERCGQAIHQTLEIKSSR
jgi:hypothetical protein